VGHSTIKKNLIPIHVPHRYSLAISLVTIVVPISVSWLGTRQDLMLRIAEQSLLHQCHFYLCSTCSHIHACFP